MDAALDTPPVLTPPGMSAGIMGMAAKVEGTALTEGIMPRPAMLIMGAPARDDPAAMAAAAAAAAALVGNMPARGAMGLPRLPLAAAAAAAALLLLLGLRLRPRRLGWVTPRPGAGCGSCGEGAVTCTRCCGCCGCATIICEASSWRRAAARRG